MKRYSEYLEASDVIDWKSESIQQLAKDLQRHSHGEEDLARRCFEWVRDNIQHTLDFDRPELSCQASEVLSTGTGYCYAKSHLLAALLRANGIPAGFCYQRLTVERDQPPFCLHGLNAVYLPQIGWFRIDPRGNKTGVNAQFTPPTEQLAFSTNVAGEFDFPEVWSAPLPIVVESLTEAATSENFLACLPDLTANQMATLRESATVKPKLTQASGV